MITRSMKRIVLGIIESAHEVSDAWKRHKTRNAVEREKLIKALGKLEKAVQRLDRIQYAKEKTDGTAGR